MNLAYPLQCNTKELSPATLEKRRRRKQERERKKRKRRELRAKEVAKATEATEAVVPPPEAPSQEAQGQPGLLFNKVRAGASWKRGDPWLRLSP